jgi:beta-glucanase (GH16 family)
MPFVPGLSAHVAPLALLVLLGTTGREGDAAVDPLRPVAAGRGEVVSAATRTEDFSDLDPSRWIAGTHVLGRSRLRPEHVVARDSTVALVLPAGAYEGAEIRSAARYGVGTYEVRMRTARMPGSISAFFLYEGVPGDRNDEIDIEIHNDGSRRMMLTTWVAGRRTNHVTLVLPFDPSDAFHTYGVEHGPRRLRFLVDGVLVHEFTRKLPTKPMHVMANAWWPAWLTAPIPVVASALEIDWIRY